MACVKLSTGHGSQDILIFKVGSLQTTASKDNMVHRETGPSEEDVTGAWECFQPAEP